MSFLAIATTHEASLKLQSESWDHGVNDQCCSGQGRVLWFEMDLNERCIICVECANVPYMYQCCKYEYRSKWCVDCTSRKVNEWSSENSQNYFELILIRFYSKRVFGPAPPKREGSYVTRSVSPFVCPTEFSYFPPLDLSDFLHRASLL